MKKRMVRMSVAVIAGLAIVFGGVWLLTRTLGEHETLYRGKPADYWSAQLNGPDASASNQANAVVSGEIIPSLVNVMFCDTNDSRLRLALVDKLNTLPGVNIYFEPADGRRALAARGLGEFGLATKPAIPVLLQALKSKDTILHGPAVGALGKIHGEPDTIIPLLIGYLDDNELNDEAATALGNFGPQAKAALPKLIPMLEIPNKDLHHALVGALKQIDPTAAAQAGVK
ncbi:MAG TPA: HEAT repeat domain-containing protein [Candidatus Dormibacteraeota bacterium]|nr:HEAT repeat domain-containing protein [Candidatus Dormibacteraeota bacterium]